MPSFLSRKLVVLIAAVAVVAAAGGAYAATRGPSATSGRAFLNDVARRLHVTPAALRQALRGASVDRLQALVADGRLTQTQASRLERAIRNGRFGPGAGFPPFPGPPAFAHPGPGGAPAWRLGVMPGPGRPGGLLPPVPFLGIGLGAAARAAESYLGLSQTRLVSELRSGKSLAQIARAQGRTAAGLQTAIESAYRTRLSALVSSKRLTPMEEREMLSRLRVVISRVMAHPLPLPPPGWGVGRRLFRGPRPWIRPGAARPRLMPPASASVPHSSAGAIAFQ